MSLALHPIYNINGKQAVKLKSFAQITNYSDTYLSKTIRNLKQKGINISTKWKRNEYIFLPKNPIQEGNGLLSIPLDYVETPNGDTLIIDWEAAFNFLNLDKRIFTLITSFIILDGTPYIGATLYAFNSSTLSPKNPFPYVQPQLRKFPATTDYKYGYYIYYDTSKMSIFNSGADGTLKSTHLPQAVLELARYLDAAENSRNGANPGLTPRRNLSTNISLDTGTVAIAATFPIISAIQADGTDKISVTDYLSPVYSAFKNGGGTLKSTNLIAAFVEASNLLAAAEKAVTPTDDQPNNIFISIDKETQTITITANLPFTTNVTEEGDFVVMAIDYL